MPSEKSRAGSWLVGLGHKQVRLTALGCGLLLSVSGCSGLIDPDPYLGTIDPSGFDVALQFATSSTSPARACLLPRRGWSGQGGTENANWFYLGGLSASQLDLANAADPTKALPPSVYQLTGCNAPEGRADIGTFDPRLDNYRKDVQYPIWATGFVPALAGAAAEPTRLSTYRPFHLLVPAELQSSVRDRMGCNDVKSERSLLERAGWSRESKVFPESGPTDFTLSFPARDLIRKGTVTYKDWPMVSVAVPVGSSTDPTVSCPFVTGSQAKYPRYFGDPDATFQFPSQHWLRGLLGGYLDGGDVPVNTDPMKCPAIVPTIKSCSMMSPCDTAAGEQCVSSRCLARTPICPVLNELWVSKDEATIPMAANAADPLPNAKVTLKDPADMTKTRSADAIAIFAVAPGQQGFSPVCRVRYYDPSKVSCARKESDSIAPRPLCTVAELMATPDAQVSAPEVYVHCLALAAGKR